MDAPWPLLIAAIPLAPLLAVALPLRLARSRMAGLPLLRAAGIGTVVIRREALTGEGLVIERIDGADPALVLALAAAVEVDEALGLAIRCACLERAIAPSRGIVQDTRRFTHRSRDGEDLTIDPADVLVADADALRAAGIEPMPEPPGRRAAQIAWRGAAVGLLVLGTAEREGAREAVASLAPLRVVLATPEPEVPARRTADRFGIDEALARCPAEKLPDQLRILRGDGGVALVGAPVAGADLVLPAEEDPREAVRPLRVARLFRGVVTLNLLAAAAFHGAALAFALQGRLEVLPAVLGSALAVALVAVNSARLARA